MKLGMSLEDLLEEAVRESSSPEEVSSLSLEEERVEELFRKGVGFLKAGEFLQAAAHFLAVTLLEPEHQKAWNNLGIAYFKLGELEEARLAFEKALSLAPEDPLPRKNLSLLENLLKKKQQKEGRNGPQKACST